MIFCWVNSKYLPATYSKVMFVQQSISIYYFGYGQILLLPYLKLYTTYYTSDICVKKQNDLYQSTIGVQFFLQDPASKLESTSQKLGHVSRVAEFFEVSVVRVPLC